MSISGVPSFDAYYDPARSYRQGAQQILSGSQTAIERGVPYLKKWFFPEQKPRVDLPKGKAESQQSSPKTEKSPVVVAHNKRGTVK